MIIQLLYCIKILNAAIFTTYLDTEPVSACIFMTTASLLWLLLSLWTLLHEFSLTTEAVLSMLLRAGLSNLRS